MAGNTQADETLPYTLVGAVRIVRSHVGRIPNRSEVPDTMNFIWCGVVGGGGIWGGQGCPSCGRYPRAAKNSLKPPPQKTPVFFEFGSSGGV